MSFNRQAKQKQIQEDELVKNIRIALELKGIKRTWLAKQLELTDVNLHRRMHCLCKFSRQEVKKINEVLGTAIQIPEEYYTK